MSTKHIRLPKNNAFSKFIGWLLVIAAFVAVIHDPVGSGQAVGHVGQNLGLFTQSVGGGH